MKKNNVSTIFAILLILSGVIFVPRALAQEIPPAAAVQANPINIVWDYPAHGPGDLFTVYVDIVNVTGLFSFQCGFYFNASYLQVKSVIEGGFLSANGADPLLVYPGSIDNTGGLVWAYGWTLTDDKKAKSGSGHLMTVQMQIKSTLWPPYTDGYPGGPVTMMHFSTEFLDPAQLLLFYKDGMSPIPINNIYNGSFTLKVTPSHPIASFTITPASVIIGASQTFNASGSTSGYNGTASVPIDWYYFQFGDGNSINQSSPVTTYTYSAIGTFTANLTVHAGITGTDSITHPAVVLPPLLSVSILPTSTTLDVGQSQLFTSSTSGGVWPYSYQWVLNGVAVSGATSATWTFTPSVSGSYSVYVNVTDNVGQKAKSNVAPVTVHPALSVDISPVFATIIIGKTQTFTSIVSGGTSPYSYQWYLNGSIVSEATSNTWAFTPPAIGVYIIYAEVTDAVNFVAQSSNAQLVVNPPPLVAVNVIQSASIIELGQSVFFNSTVSGGSSPYTYQWYLNDSAVTGANYPTWTFTPVSIGTYSVFLQATDASGYVGESAIVIIVVNPTLGVSVSPDSVVLDVGESWVFIANPFNGTPPYIAYQWYIDDSPVINATSATWTFTPYVVANRTVYVIVTDSLGITCKSNLVSVTVSSAMSPTISPLSVVMDLGMSQQYTVSVSGGTPPYSYQWYQWFPDGSQPFAGANENTFVFTPSSAGFNLIYVEITDSLGAKVYIGATATVNPLPTVSILPNAVTMDIGQSQTFSAIVSGGTLPYSLQWYLNGTVIVGATSSSYTFMPASAGTYNIFLTATDAFGMSATSNIAVIVANPPPTILVSPSSVALDVGEPWTFIASIFNGTPPYSSYQWYIDGSPVAGATSSTWTFMPLSVTNHVVYVTSTDSVGFECTSNMVIVTVSAAMNPSIYPVSATLDLGQSQEYTVQVSGGTAPYSYQWYQWLPTGCMPFPGATSATFTFTPTFSGLNIIYVIITDSLGVQVNWGATANVNPPLSASISPKSVIMDIGMSQKFTAIAVNGTLPYAYQWYIDGTLVVGETSSTWTYTPTLPSVGVHTIYVAVTDAVNSTVQSDYATIIVNPPLTADVFPTSAATDLGLSVSFTSSASGGMAPYSFQWYVNDTSTGAVGSTFTIMPTSAGIYIVSVVITDAFGFNASSTALVTINPLPIVTLTPTSASINLGEYQAFTATVTFGTSPYYYRWYVDGVLAAETLVPTYLFTPPSISTYYQLSVKITDAVGVNATSNSAIINGHDVAVIGVASTDNSCCPIAKTVFAKGYPIGMNVTVKNVGYYSETFNTTTYANETAISSQNVTLIPGEVVTLILNGTTAQLAYGHYIISAIIPLVTGEVNNANNYIANSTRITVTIPGDVNGDGIVNIRDATLVGMWWQQLVPPALPEADINGDGIVNIRDATLVGLNWQKQVEL